METYVLPSFNKSKCIHISRCLKNIMYYVVIYLKTRLLEIDILKY